MSSLLRVDRNSAADSNGFSKQTECEAAAKLQAELKQLCCEKQFRKQKLR